MLITLLSALPEGNSLYLSWRSRVPKLRLLIGDWDQVRVWFSSSSLQEGAGYYCNKTAHVCPCHSPVAGEERGKCPQWNLVITHWFMTLFSDPRKNFLWSLSLLHWNKMQLHLWRLWVVVVEKDTASKHRRMWEETLKWQERPNNLPTVLTSMNECSRPRCASWDIFFNHFVSNVWSFFFFYYYFFNY